jgi:hypothetical protein
MGNTLRERGWVRRAGLLCGVAGLVLFGVAATAGASRPVPQQVGILPILLRSSPSDPRAVFHDGNVDLCSGVGFPASDQLGALGNNTASDGNVSGTPAPNNGSIQPGQGEELNVTVLNPDVVIDAVVVKGGNGYNVYPNPAAPPPILPPGLPPPQHYISPFNGGGNVPELSHWFVCYHLTTPPPVGSLTVRKTVIAPPSLPSTPLPTTYTAIVNCNDGVHVNVPVSFGLGGGRSAGGTITGIAPGTVCTVVEDTASLPPGTVVTYDPAGADTTGVTIVANAGVTVTVTNDFSGLTPQSGNLQLVKALLPAPPGVTLPASYTARVLCDDGTDTNVTLPGTGGTGTPLVSVDANALCAVGEDIAGLPAGWVVTYSVDGGAPSSSPPVFVVTENTTVTVTITNDPSAVAATTVPPPTPEPTAAPTMPSTLPPTGAGMSAPATVGVVLVAVGLVAIGYAARRRPSGES